MHSIFRPLAMASALSLAACGSGADSDELTGLYDGIADSETITLVGTEPFWSMEVSSESLTYSTPENPDGQQTAITRFAGNGGLGVAGTLDGEPLQVAVTPGDCSDGMSDRIYPFTATASVGESTLFGCGYTDAQPFSGDQAP